MIAVSLDGFSQLGITERSAAANDLSPFPPLVPFVDSVGDVLPVCLGKTFEEPPFFSVDTHTGVC